MWTELTTDTTQLPEGEGIENDTTENTNTSETQDVEDNSVGSDEESETDDEDSGEEEISKLRGVKLDTCIQSDDPTIEASNRVLSIAPGEGNTPINIVLDEKFEEMAFPTLFSTGKFALTYPRPVSISAKKYFQRRKMEHGGRFASNIEYLFVVQFLSERQQIKNSISVALRKAFGEEESGDIFTAAEFKNPDRIRPLLKKDKAYRFLRPVRASLPYWQQVMFKLLSVIKKLKIFTWFFTLSAANLRWTDTLQGIAKQQGTM